MNLRRFRYKFFKLRYQLQNSFARRGMIGTTTIILNKLLRGSGTPKQFAALHPFDSEFGVETSGLIRAEEICDSGRKYNPYNTGYFATAPSVFSQICRRLDVDFRDFTFVDLGSGKGRILLLASNFPFRRVLGVEILPALHEAALKNIALFHPASRQCGEVHCLLGDVTEFEFPSGPLVVFMWNPFIGPVFKSVLANLEASLRREPRELYLLYLQPDLDYLMAASPCLRKLWLEEFELADEDHTAHAFGSRVEACAAYRSICEIGIYRSDIVRSSVPVKQTVERQKIEVPHR